MMTTCTHLKPFDIKDKADLLNPEKWRCSVCGFTESVWACLECCNVACGRQSNQHAQQHNKLTKHPLALEINNQYLYCYRCDDYVLNDTPNEDVQGLRELLEAVSGQSFEGLSQEEASKKEILPAVTRFYNPQLSVELDREATAVCHYRRQLLLKCFTAWRTQTREGKGKPEEGVSSPSRSARRQPVPSSPPITRARKRALNPGVIGLRNLGNTCYMNSVLQVLSHVEVFRTNFLNLDLLHGRTPDPAGLRRVPKRRSAQRQNTIDCFEHLTSTPESTESSPERRPREGLSGGGSVLSQADPVQVEQSTDNLRMSRELHGLLRVMWSGKWAQVGPNSFLAATWHCIPEFRGYKQQDAQEFLSMLMTRVQEELTKLIPLRRRRREVDLVTKVFQGQLVSTVTCQACKRKSSRLDSFYDLSLEFPNRYQRPSKKRRSADPEESCHITEMLAKFTEIEDLGEVYRCEHCNAKRKSRTRQSQPVLTHATKQLLLRRLPEVLWLHLKRFRWVGREHREKISAHVAFNEDLDLSPYVESSRELERFGTRYRLCGVVIHHGRGFTSGHYTALCWNPGAGDGSWVNFNDVNVQLTEEDKVLSSQAYILVYCHQAPPSPDPAAGHRRRNSIVQQVDDKVYFRIPSEEVLAEPEERISSPDTSSKAKKRIPNPDTSSKAKKRIPGPKTAPEAKKRISRPETSSEAKKRIPSPKATEAKKKISSPETSLEEKKKIPSPETSSEAEKKIPSPETSSEAEKTIPSPDAPPEPKKRRGRKRKSES